MILCNSRKFIFVHLHKTAGMSVMEALRPHLSVDDFVISDDRHGPSSQGRGMLPHALYKHSTAEHISRVVGESTWNSYFTFAFVRHPLDRLVSLYEFFNRVRRNNTARPGILKQLFFLGTEKPSGDSPDQPPWSWEGMQALLTTSDFSGFIRSEHLAKAQGAKPQIRSLTDKSGNLLVDFVGKVENISDDWQKICVRLGIQQTLRHENQSERQFDICRSYWNQDDLEFVLEKYREDFEMFSYSPDDVL